MQIRPLAWKLVVVALSLGFLGTLSCGDSKSEDDSSECSTNTPCSECPGSGALICNNALPTPACQQRGCGAEGSPCSETALCNSAADLQCVDQTCQRVNSSLGSACEPDFVVPGGFDATNVYTINPSSSCGSKPCVVYGVSGNPRADCSAECSTQPDVNQRVFCSCRCDSGAQGDDVCPCTSGFRCEFVAGLQSSYCVRDTLPPL